MDKIHKDKKYPSEAAEGVYEKVLDCLELHPRISILDVPCGAGVFSNMLLKNKMKVTYGDIKPDKCVIGEAEYVDMNKNLPYKSKVFDIVTCIEGVEHIENPHHIIREFNRVLKQNGLLIITTPNILNIKSRIKFLLSGTFFWFDSETIQRNAHINPIPFFELKYTLENCGFYLERIETNHIYFFHIPFTWFIKTVKALLFRRLDKNMNKSLLLLGEILIIKCRKIKNVAQTL